MDSVRERELRLANQRWMRATALGCASSKPPRTFNPSECDRLEREYWRTVEEGEMRTEMYIATFNSGALEEKFYAVSYEHAHEVAHEIAARKRAKFDAVQLLEKEGPCLE